MTQILKNTGSLQQVTFYADGTPTDADGNVTVTITLPDGTAHPQSPVTIVTNNGNTGVYEFALNPSSDPTILELEWAGTFSAVAQSVYSTIEVVGGFLFTEATARNWGVKADSTNKPLGSETEYPDATIRSEIARVTDDLEQWTHRSWVERYARVELSGTGAKRLYLGEGACRTASGGFLNRPGRGTDISKVLSATVGGVTVSTANIVIDPILGELTLTSGSWASSSGSNPYNVIIEYVYGLPVPVDGSDRIGLDLLIDRLVPSAIPDRATSWDTDFGTVRVVTEGGPMANKTRLPHVNQWLAQHMRRSF